MAKRVVAHKLVVSSSRLLAIHELKHVSTGCSVSAVVGDDGSVSDPECVNDSCSGECELRRVETSEGVEYFCECVI
jgi:hypothetical protein